MGTTSYSEVSSYLQCRRRHWYGYGMNLERKDTSESLFTGKALHAALETYYGHILAVGEDSLAAQQAAQEDAASYALAKWNEVRPEQNDKRADLTHSLELYFQDEPWVAQGYRVLSVEREFVLTYDEEGNQYPFVVDLIVEDPYGEVVVIDHKTGYEFLSDGNAEYLQPQLPLYMGALRAMGYPASYAAYNQFRTRKIKAPTKEQLLQVTVVRPNATRITTTFLEHVHLASEISQRKLMSVEHQAESAYRTANKMVCQSCPFAELCISDLIGSNSNLVIATQYKERTRRQYAPVVLEEI